MSERLVNLDLERLFFRSLLGVYVSPRPRTYAERKWLEGYCEACVTVRRVQMGTTAREIIRAFRATLFLKDASGKWFKLSQKQKGHCDAWLDSVGC